jgi:hypothetical protein
MARETRTTLQRRVDVFTAAWPLCEDTVRLVSSLALPQLRGASNALREGYVTNECREKTARCGVTAVPAVTVNGVLVACCRRASITADRLIAAGIGFP